MWIQGLRSLPPASSNSTRVVRSAVSRFASTQPAEPVPTMMKSNSPVSCIPTLREIGFTFYRTVAACHMMSCNLTEHEMRVAVLAFIGLIALPVISITAEALPAGSGGTEAAPNQYYRQVAQGCGPGFHWVAKHRNRYGAWVPGHCARN